MSITPLNRRYVRLALAALPLTVAATTAVSAQEGATCEIVASFDDPIRSGANPMAPLLQANPIWKRPLLSTGGRLASAAAGIDVRERLQTKHRMTVRTPCLFNVPDELAVVVGAVDFPRSDTAGCNRRAQPRPSQKFLRD
jgi:hypothetical protein